MADALLDAQTNADADAQGAASLAAPRDGQDDESEEHEIVAVGAVAHVVRRAFHQFYSDEDAVPTTAAKAAPLSGADGAPPTVAPTSATSTPRQDLPAALTATRDDADALLDASAHPTARDAVEPSPPPVNPFVLLGETRRAQIEHERKRKHADATALLRFLDARHRDAQDADDAIAATLSDRGLVIKAQIPIGPSNLRLDAREVQLFGAFAHDLVHATQLVREYHDRRLERSGNGPDALARKQAAAPGIISEPLGYLDATDSSSIRTHATLTMHERHIELVKTHHQSSSNSSKATATSSSLESTEASPDEDHGKSSSHVSPTKAHTSAADARNAQMSAGEKRKNLEILERMQTKLDFLRNPRFAPSDRQSASETLTSPTHAPTPHDAADAEGSSSSTCFVVVPSPVEFTDYDIGGVYEQLVYIRNTSALSRRLRVLPPATLYFSIDALTFPDPSGLIAPGMHVQVRLRFAPDSRADYKDALRIAHESSSGSRAEFTIPLAARRTPPELSIPLVLKAQHTLVGTHSVTRLPCRNTGGKARFWLMTEDDWGRYEHSAARFLKHEQSRASGAERDLHSLNDHHSLPTAVELGPFTLTPTEFELDTNESVDLALAYVPSCIGEQRRKFVMVCDNCLVRTFQVVGRGCQVELSVSSVNDKAIDASVAHMGVVDHVAFDALAVHARATQRFVVANDTPIDLVFTWRLEPSTAPPEQTRVIDDTPPPYTITPASGVLALNAAMEFAVTFVPTDARHYAWTATLVVNNVPACSLPGPDQRALLLQTFAQIQASLDNVVLSDVPSMRVQLHGTGVLGSFSVVPSYWPVGTAGDSGATAPLRLLEKHVTYTTSLDLCNDTAAPVAFAIDTARVTQRHATGAASILSYQVSPSPHPFTPPFDLVVTPAVGELAPLSRTAVTVAFTPHCVGPFSLALPCRIPTHSAASSSPSFVRWLLLEGSVARGDVAIVSPEVDFGLVLVGASAEATVTLRNTSIVPAEWRLVHVEAAATVPSALGLAADASRRVSNAALQRSSSKDSIVSRRSSASSSGNDTSRSSNALFTARDTLPRATIAFVPEAGTLAPNETRSIKVLCLAGSLPERLRASFRVELSPERTFVSHSASGASMPTFGPSVSARAEIQAPNVFLTPSKLHLGTTYLGVAVHRTLALVNVSNLAAQFKFVEPQGASRAYSVAFAPKSGTIASKETLSVVLTYTPRQAGKTTVLIACAVTGLAAPLGLEVTTTQKGLVLAYELIASDSRQSTLSADVRLPKAPKDIALDRGLALADCDLEPESLAIPKLAFGDAIPLGERRMRHVLIRNFSGIDAVLELEAKKFPARPSSGANAASPVSSTASLGSTGSLHSSPVSSSNASISRKAKRATGAALDSSSPKSKRKTAAMSTVSSLHSTSSSSSKKKALLTDAHEQPNRFQSDRGRDYVRQCADDVEDRDVLSHGHGVAFAMRPSRVRIPAWDQRVVAVVCYNNMPGTYADDIVSRAVGVPPVFLHAQATVVGTPLTLDRNCVGLYYPTKTPSQQPTFHFGQLCTKAPPLTRTLRVVNRGPKHARLKWKLVEHGREHELVTLTLRVDFASHVQLRITPCNDDDVVFPFTVSPEHAVVPPFATVPFQITYTPAIVVSAARALLLADAYWYDATEDGASKTPSSLEVLENQHPSASTDDDGSASALDPRCESPSSKTTSMHTAAAAGKAFVAVRAANSLARRVPASSTSALANATPSHVSPKCLRVLLAADVIEPELFLDRSMAAPTLRAKPSQALSHSSDSSKRYHIKFTTWSTLVATPSDAAHAFHRHELFLVNRTSTRLTFRLESTGPFAVFRADSLAPKHPLSSAELPPAHRRAHGESFMFTLPPQMSVRMDVRFDPTQWLSASTTPTTSAIAPVSGLAALGNSPSNAPRLSALASPLKSPSPLSVSEAQRLKTLVYGELLVKFTNRSIQTLSLIAEVLRPLVVVSPSVHFFGHVHLSKTRTVVLRVANPTAVPAAFRITHVPAPAPVSKAQKQEFATHHAHFVDTPSVFAFSTTHGVVLGPTTTLQSTGSALPSVDSMHDVGPHPLVHAPLNLTVTFQALAVKTRYRSRFRFVVAHGVDFDVVLEGEGHVQELDVRDQSRSLVPTRALEHSDRIFTKILQ